jgi:hypothetical protein
MQLHKTPTRRMHGLCLIAKTACKPSNFPR